MSGLSDLKVKIKNQPHNLAWINDKERSVLKAMGGSGKAGPMGIPAYDTDNPSGGEEGEDSAPGWSGESVDSITDTKDDNGNGDYDFNDEDWGSAIEEARAAEQQAAHDKATAEQSALDTGMISGKSRESQQESIDAAGRVAEEIAALEEMGLLDEQRSGTREEAFDRKEREEDKARAMQATLEHNLAGRDVTMVQDPDGSWSYTGPDALSAFGYELSKGIGDIVGNIGYGLGGLATAAMNLTPLGIVKNMIGGKEGLLSSLGLPSIGPLHPDFDIGPKIGRDMRGLLGGLADYLGKAPEDIREAVSNLFDIPKDQVTKDHIESYAAKQNFPIRTISEGITPDSSLIKAERAGGGQVYNNFITRNEGGQVGEGGSKSAMELYLEKLGQPSKYTIPAVSMDVPSMAPPPAGSDPFELAEYRKGLARETMGNYLPFDVGGASEALNAFNENYYGGASNVSPYNMAQLASLLGLPRSSDSYEGIIGMLGGVRNEPPSDPIPLPPPPLEIASTIVPDDPYDDEGGPGPDEENLGNPPGFAKHGGGIGRVLQRQAGGMTTHEGLQGFGMQSPRPFGITPFSSGLR